MINDWVHCHTSAAQGALPRCSSRMSTACLLLPIPLPLWPGCLKFAYCSCASLVPVSRARATCFPQATCFSTCSSADSQSPPRRLLLPFPCVLLCVCVFVCAGICRRPSLPCQALPAPAPTPVCACACAGALAGAPALVEALTNLTAFRGFAGTSVLIMVGVATDTARCECLFLKRCAGAATCTCIALFFLGCSKMLCGEHHQWCRLWKGKGQPSNMASVVASTTG